MKVGQFVYVRLSAELDPSRPLLSAKIGIRLYLAGRGLTLADDRTPEFWLKRLGETRIGHTMGDDDEGRDRADIAPFVVLIDTQEQQPFSFQGITQDSDRDHRPLIVPTQYKHLGAAMAGLLPPGT